MSYWVNGTLLGMVFGALAGGLGAIDITESPRLLTFSFAALTIVAFPMVIWQAVGIWRSANRLTQTRHRVGKKAPWAGVAKAATVLGCLSGGGNLLAYGLPNIWANLEIALGEDPTPHHVLRIVNGGREIEIGGGFDFGTAADLAKLLDASTSVRIIDLDNVGGRVAEGQHVRDLIRQRHLATYTATMCASACTVAYMGGYPRYLGPDGKLGFHRYTFPGLTPERDSQMNWDGEQALIAAGVSRDFAHKAFSTPSESIWTPDAATLMAANVVTQIVDGMAFAVPSSGVTTENIERSLENVAAFGTLKRAAPAIYAEAIANIESGIKQGKTLQEVVNTAHVGIMKAAVRYRPIAGDDVQVEIAALIADEAKILAPAHPDACMVLLEGPVNGPSDYTNYLPTDVQNRDSSLTADIVGSGSTAPRHDTASEETASAQITRIWTQVRKTGIDVQVVTRKPASTEEQRSYCLAMAAFFQGVSAMPTEQAGKLMRYLLRQS